MTRRVRPRPARITLIALALLGAPFLSSWAFAADDTKFPHFVSLKQAEVNMREGPSPENKIRWVYHRKNLPVEVLAQYDVWRRVRDADGEIGWINANMLSRQRAAIVTGKAQAMLRARSEANADIVAKVEPGSVGLIKRCEAEVCELRFEKVTGWVERARLWGVYPDEKF